MKQIIDNLSTNLPVEATDQVYKCYQGVGLRARYQFLDLSLGLETVKGNFWPKVKFIQDKNLDSVDIVCHSMGGFVARAAHILGHAPIKRAVYIASPHFGTPMGYFELNPEIRIMARGFSVVLDNLPIEAGLKDLIDGALEKEWKDLYRKWPSGYELMPDEFYLEKNAFNHKIAISKSSEGKLS